MHEFESRPLRLLKEKMNFISKTDLIAKTVEKYPFLAELMMERGLHCVGCVASPVETIEEGVKSHGASDKEVNELIKQLNNAISIHGIETPILTITNSAVKQIKKMKKEKKKENSALRVRAESSGCCAVSYSMGFASEKKEDEKQVEINGITTYYSIDAENRLRGTIINWSAEKGFVLMNPNKKECKCN